ncbi:MAG: hypothetical protein M0Q42_01700 [Xanthomonadales bacterium]|nr:hypothetical protein [Xanthomonadales bacterium]
MISSPRVFSSGHLFLATLLLMACAASNAQQRFQIPDEVPGPPFYARIEFPSVDPAIVPHNGEWAAIVIYRNEDCIPNDFNLLDVFDVPAAFLCPLNNLAGYEVWANGPGMEPSPIRSRLIGQGPVPVWFVHHDEFSQAIDDGVLTIGELRNLGSLRIGNSDFYDELLRPSQSSDSPLLHINSNGRFEDGGRFRLLWTLSADPAGDAFVSRTRIELPGERAGVDTPPLVFPFTGIWYDTALPGQGLSIHPVRGQDRVFAAWYTYDSYGQPTWYTMDTCAAPGSVECDGVFFDGLHGEFSIMRSIASPHPTGAPESEPVGTMTIDFTGCTTATANYTLAGVEGEMSLVSLIPADNCLD